MLKQIFFLLAVLANWSGSAAYGKESPPTKDGAAIETLVIGDEYIIDVAREGGHQRLQGQLHREDEDWIVLVANWGYRMGYWEARSERGIPVMSKLPYINRLFKNVGVGRTASYLWIPRRDVQISGRIRPEQGTPSEPFPMATLAPGVSVEAERIIDGELVSRDGTLISIDSAALVMEYYEVEFVDRSPPVLPHLPLIGEWFSVIDVEEHRRRVRIPLEEVVCIRSDVPDEIRLSELEKR